ncbi:hypothetical protein ACIQNG_26195 [Streptomyces sp. NPDC091377]|uniref:hypothetical protein n=1 Tax=Streptomyces sp. NPDC091377 TaxID=3365995 RepID=UPI0038199AE0
MHHFTFDTDGTCTGTPYDRQVPRDRCSSCSSTRTPTSGTTAVSHPPPRLARGDGPIGAFRRWADRFRPQHTEAASMEDRS